MRFSLTNLLSLDKTIFSLFLALDTMQITDIKKNAI
jgi:hypothetical protein